MIYRLKQHLKNIQNFLKQCKRPTIKEYKEILLLHLKGMGLLGAFAYGIIVINIPIKNFFLGSNK